MNINVKEMKSRKNTRMIIHSKPFIGECNIQKFDTGSFSYSMTLKKNESIAGMSLNFSLMV